MSPLWGKQTLTRWRVFDDLAICTSILNGRKIFVWFVVTGTALLTPRLVSVKQI
jgi:hypothetical protein